jgi:hypothetical protein
MPSPRPSPEQALRYGQIAATIREGMERLQLTPTTLAAAMGFPELKNPSALLSPWINAKGAPGQKYVGPLAKALGVRISDLTAKELPENGHMVSAPTPPRTKIGRPPSDGRKPALTFQINNDGTARINVDFTTDTARALTLFRTLIDAGVIETTPNNGDETQC